MRWETLVIVFCLFALWLRRYRMSQQHTLGCRSGPNAHLNYEQLELITSFSISARKLFCWGTFSVLRLVRSFCFSTRVNASEIFTFWAEAGWTYSECNSAPRVNIGECSFLYVSSSFKIFIYCLSVGCRNRICEIPGTLDSALSERKVFSGCTVRRGCWTSLEPYFKATGTVPQVVKSAINIFTQDCVNGERKVFMQVNFIIQLETN